MVLASTVDAFAGGVFARASLVRRRCGDTAGCVSRAAFPARTAAAMSATATSAAPAPLAAFSAISALRAVAIDLTLLSACLDAGAWLAAR